MRVGLLGFTFGHENMGCQALTCSFLEMLRRNFPSEKITVVDFHAENTMGIVPELFPEMQFERVRIKLKDFSFSYLHEIKKCDVIFDETFGDGFSDIYFTKNVYKSTLIKYVISKTKVPFILTPQTYGPFQHKSLEKLAGYAIKHATVVYARDEISGRYAEKISGRQVRVTTDLAFALPFYRDEAVKHRLRLGINVSGLLWQGGFTGGNQFGLLTDYRAYCKKLIEYGMSQGYEIHMIPHVTLPADVNRKVPDGDYPVCKELVEEYRDVVLAPCFRSPYEAKNYIAGMDYFIGARMHATIGALSSGVRTIAFAYSRKFRGLYDDLGYPYYVDGTKLETKEAVARTIDFLQRSGEMEEAQAKAVGRVSDENAKFEQELVSILKTRIKNSD